MIGIFNNREDEIIRTEVRGARSSATRGERASSVVCAGTGTLDAAQGEAGPIRGDGTTR